eukprot:1737057-Amphidinium_carterae.1
MYCVWLGARLMWHWRVNPVRLSRNAAVGHRDLVLCVISVWPESGFGLLEVRGFTKLVKVFGQAGVVFYVLRVLATVHLWK